MRGARRQGPPQRYHVLGTIAPLPGNADKDLPPWVKAWLEPEVLVPILATIVVFIVGVVVICLTLARRNTPHRLRGQKDVYCMYGGMDTALFPYLFTSSSVLMFLSSMFICIYNYWI